MTPLTHKLPLPLTLLLLVGCAAPRAADTAACPVWSTEEEWVDAHCARRSRCEPETAPYEFTCLNGAMSQLCSAHDPCLLADCVVELREREDCAEIEVCEEAFSEESICE
ncbi:hypothetical protein L6R49_02600 [Myxococcota bacterium]|nr:hypothetical protein [Myxococcota bacterium]